MTKDRYPPFDPRFEDDQSPLANLVAHGEKVGNVKDKTVADKLDLYKDQVALLSLIHI